MSSEKHRRLVDALIEKTSKGQLEWKATVNDNEFQVSFSTYSLGITSERGASGQDIVIYLYNDQGEVAERFTDVDVQTDSIDPVWFSKMKQLLDTARRSAMGADKILNSILNELDDEIPF